MNHGIRIDLTGLKFNELLVLKKSDKVLGGKTHWECRCDCGKITTVEGYNLKSGHVKSCNDCGNRKIKAKNTKHGEKKTRLYYIWVNMKTRCSNEKYDMFKNYGGKGISVCDEWLDFRNFKEWALKNGYNKKLTIDRIDNEKNYYPDNCKWSTMKEQQNNRANNHLITYNGETLTLAQWSEKLEISTYWVKKMLEEHRGEACGY